LNIAPRGSKQAITHTEKKTVKNEI